MNESGERAARRGRRRPGGADPAPAAPERSLGYRKLLNPFEPLRVFSADQVEALHQAALGVLEEQGMKVLSARARASYAGGGASVDEDSLMVRIDRGLVAQALASAPRALELHAVDPAHNVLVGGRHVSMAPTSGPPNIMDSERGRRAGTLEDFCNLMKLCQSFEVIQVLGGAVEPQDVPVHIRHLEVMSAQLLLTDKIPFIFSRGRQQVADNFELLRIAHGLSEEEFAARPCTYTVINTNSPLQLDVPMAEGIIDFALAGQPTIITPFTLAGAMAPVTIAGALMLAHAEALAGLVPRHIGLRWRSSSATASNIPDAQAAYEAQMSLWGALMGGCNFILHAAGWMESGLATSYEKFILDIEMLQMFAEVFQPVATTAAELGVEAVSEVGPGGHFFGCAHTMERYRTAFYAPLVSDWRNYGSWLEDGGRTATQRASTIWRATLGNFRAPARDPAVVEALEACVARRKSEGGAPPVS